MNKVVHVQRCTKVVSPHPTPQKYTTVLHSLKSTSWTVHPEDDDYMHLLQIPLIPNLLEGGADARLHILVGTHVLVLLLRPAHLGFGVLQQFSLHQVKRERCQLKTDGQELVKPILNWVNVCSPEHTSDTSMNYDSFLNWTFSSPNMVRTVQTLLHSQLACNEMQASARTYGRHHDRKCRLKSSQYTLIIPHRVTDYYLILGLRNKAAPSTSQQIPFETSEEPSNTVIHFYFCFFFIHRRALLSANQRQWSSIRVNVPRTCWAKVFGPRI